MDICGAKLIDVVTVCEIDRSIIGNNGRREFLSSAIAAGKCFIARINNIVVGFIVFDTSFFGNGFISLVMVNPHYRRSGVSTALIRHVEENCPTEKLFTSTNESNVPMQRVCEALGFVRSGWIDNLDEGDPEIVYFKLLRN